MHIGPAAAVRSRMRARAKQKRTIAIQASFIYNVHKNIFPHKLYESIAHEAPRRRLFPKQAHRRLRSLGRTDHRRERVARERDIRRARALRVPRRAGKHLVPTAERALDAS